MENKHKVNFISGNTVYVHGEFDKSIVELLPEIQSVIDTQKAPQKLLTLISSVCEKHDLRFGQLIEIIKKEDWFYKKDEEIIILIENFLKEYGKTNSD